VIKNKSNVPTVTGFNFISLALYAFGGLGIEVIYAYVIEPMIYGADMQNWTVCENIIHWVVTCITWGIIGYSLIKYSKSKYEFDLFEIKTAKVKVWQWICVLFCIIFVFYLSYNDWGGFKLVIEYQNKGILKFIFQCIYYAFETVLFMLIIMFGQKACEVWFGKVNFPYGGIIVAVTWGLVHILSKGSVWMGVLTALSGFVYGIVYLLLNRDIKKVYPVLLLMFLI
jgi:hypothetical protein